MDYKIARPELAEQGKQEIDQAQREMPVLEELRARALATRPLEGYRIGGCLHVTKETAVLARVLKAAGAQLAWSGCNPESTKDHIAAAMALHDGIAIYAKHGCDEKEYYAYIDDVLATDPHLTIDDGADLIMRIHEQRPDLLDELLGGTEETTKGVHRLREMDKAGALKYPVIAVNDAKTKCQFDNHYGTGQSTIDGILRATNTLIAGKTFVVAGYGPCGQGVAERARGSGAKVIVTEVDPVRALKASHDGYRVMPMIDAAKEGDIFVTATSMKDVLTVDHFLLMKDGAIISNTGHFDTEINIADLESVSTGKEQVRENNERYTVPLVPEGHKSIHLLGHGRLVNLVAAEGHPSPVMDLSFANQYLSVVHLAQNTLAPGLHDIPEGQDEMIASLKLQNMGIHIDTLSREQKAYQKSYQLGT